MQKIIILTILLFISVFVFSQKPINDKKINRQIKGNWILNQPFSSSNIVLINSEDSDLTEYDLISFNEYKNITIQTISSWGCGSAAIDGQKYKQMQSNWSIENGLLHIKAKYIFKDIQYDFENFYEVKKENGKLILSKSKT